MNSLHHAATTPPKLSFACPLPWTEMTGTERSKFCSQCGHHVRNLSLMSGAERADLLQRAKSERICGTYLVRLSGEMVTPAAPLSRSEWSRVRQFGVAALSAGALALAAGCVAPNPSNTPTRADAPGPDSATTAVKLPLEQRPATLETKNDDDEIVLLAGFILTEDHKPVQAQVMY